MTVAISREEAIAALAARTRLLAEAGHLDPERDEVIPSPCISVCRMTEDRSHCQGCFRTLDELRAWAGADTPHRLAIWQRLSLRAGLPFPPALDAPTPSEVA